MRVKLRRWWKGVKELAHFTGWRNAIWNEVRYKPGVRQLNNLYWAIRHRTVNVYHVVKLDLKPGYHDVTERMVHANFCLLAEYVEKEKPFEHIDWDSDPEHQNAAAEMKALYKWWKEVYPFYEQNDPINAESVKAPRRKFESCCVDEDGDPRYYTWEVVEEDKHLEKDFSDACKASRDYEAKQEAEIEANLIRLAKIRPYLWS
jgi:hypothetical protein